MPEPRKLPSGRWRIEVKAHGKRAGETFNTKSAAREWGRWAEDELRAGRHPKDIHKPEPEVLTFSAWLPRWRELRDVSPAQAAKADSIARTHLEPAFGPRPMVELAADWEGMRVWAKELRGHGGIENSTAVTIYGIMSNIMALAVLAKVTTETPCHHIKIADGARKKTPFLLEDQVLEQAEKLVRWRGRAPRKVEDRMYATLAITAAWTGMRWGELAGMRRKHRNRHGDLTVDLLRKRIIITEDTVLHEVGGHLWMEDPKTTAGGRIVALPDFLVELLAALLASHDHEHLFTSAQGQWLRRGRFRKTYWAPAIASMFPDRVEDDRPTFHSLRTTQETLLLALDIPDRAIDIRMGHVTPGAAERYARVHPDLDRRICDGLQARYEAAIKKRAPDVRPQMLTLDA